MSQAPSMPMFWDAYIGDTTHLTIEEHGAYLLLLGAMWRRNGWVPDDDRDIARILGITAAKWRKIKHRIGPFLTFRNGQISQKNLLKIWKNTQEHEHVQPEQLLFQTVIEKAFVDAINPDPANDIDRRAKSEGCRMDRQLRPRFSPRLRVGRDGP
jgi:hypothetical protein